MSENKTKVSYIDFKDDINARIDETTEVDWLGRTITIRNTLTLPEVLAFVANVIDTCYQDNDAGELVFVPEVKDYAIAFNVVGFYTNIELTDDSDDFDTYDFITKSDIVETVLNSVDMSQFNSMIQSISAKIRYINETNSASIMSEISTFNSAMNEIIPQLNELFSGENKNEISGAIDALKQLSQDATLKQLAIAQVQNG